MRETLGKMRSARLALENRKFPLTLEKIDMWLGQMEPIQYSCLGCHHCYPAVSLNLLSEKFPDVQIVESDCSFEIKKEAWPYVAGEYVSFCKDSSCSVAVSTLASANLVDRLTEIKPRGLCIVGKTETENIGIDKIVKNTITNLSIRFLILSGRESEGHHSGKTLLALWNEGVDENMKVKNSPGWRPILKNISREDVETFRRQVQLIDMIGCEDPSRITAKISELTENAASNHTCCHGMASYVPSDQAPKIEAKAAASPIKMDKAGYFIIVLAPEKHLISVEHYAYDNRLLHTIEGKTAPAIYSIIIQNGWVTELSHAAYLGKELTKAEFNLEQGSKYIQDGAYGNFEPNLKETIG